MSSPCLNMTKFCFHQRKDAGRHTFYTGGVGMEAILEQEIRLVIDTVQEKRVKGKTIVRRELGIDGVEALLIAGVPIARGIHPDEKDPSPCLLDVLNHGGQILSEMLRGKPAEGIIGPQGKEHKLGTLCQGPGKAGAATSGGIARYASVDDPHRPATGEELALEDRGKGLGAGEAIPGREAVAQGHNGDRLGHGWSGGKKAEERKDGENRHR